jgi:hypothetical protein
MRQYTFAQVCARRLARHHLAASAADAAEAARAVGGIHAQIMSAAEVSVGLRVAGITRAGVRDALWTERTLVKTRGPRYTVHLLAATDLPMWTGALSALPTRRLELLTEQQAEQVVAALADILADDEWTTEELTDHVVARAGAWAGDPVMDAFQGKWPRWVEAMPLASRRGVMCFGANRGRKVTYTHPERWLPGLTPMDPDKALAEVVRRYLYAYGPATPAHLARWLAVPPGWAAQLFASLDFLEQVAVDGEPAFVAAGDTDLPDEPPSGVRLLPYFDAYGVGCFPRERVFPGRAFQRALAGGQAGNYPLLLVDGVVAGVWHQRRGGRRIAVTVEPFGRLGAARTRALEAQVARLGEIQEGDATLTIGEVTAGPHA